MTSSKAGKAGWLAEIIGDSQSRKLVKSEHLLWENTGIDSQDILLASLWQNRWGRLSMGFVLDFDAKNSILRVTLEDRLTDAILLDGYAAMTKYMASDPPCRSIVDASAVTKFEVSSNAVKQLAASPPVSLNASMRIFVAPKDFIFGMARMFQILTEKTRPNFHPVRTMDEAYRLLQMESPEFVPVS